MFFSAKRIGSVEKFNSIEEEGEMTRVIMGKSP